MSISQEGVKLFKIGVDLLATLYQIILYHVNKSTHIGHNINEDKNMSL